MSLLVDTYNVLGVTGVLPPEVAGLDEESLARVIARSRFAGRKAALICDGVRSRDLAGRDGARGLKRRVDGVDIIYAGGGRDADSLIERVIAEDSAPRRLLVVSSDRRVQKAAARRRCGVMSSEAFLHRLAADLAAPAPVVDRNVLREQIPLDTVSVTAWIREFGSVARGAAELLLSAGRAEAAHTSGKPQQAPAVAPPMPRTAHTPGATDQQPARDRIALDPSLRDALAASGTVDPDDLDMSRWISGVDPI